jgi:hypothetical protein
MNDTVIIAACTLIGSGLTLAGKMYWDRWRNGNGRTALKVQDLTAGEVRAHYQDRAVWERSTLGVLERIAQTQERTVKQLDASARVNRLQYRLMRHMATVAGIDVSLTPAEVDED